MPLPDRFEAVNDPRPHDRVWPELAWPIGDDVELVGETVRLSRLDPENDAAELYAALDHAQVWAHLPIAAATPEDHRAFLEGRIAHAEWHLWTVRLQRALAGLPEGAIVGTTAYLNAAPGDASLEIGATAYAPRVWASSVNPECKLLLFDYAFGVLGAGRVQLKTDVRNVRSQQAIARLGARFEGVLRRHYRRSDGTIRDSVMFSVIAEEWPDVRTGLQARLAEARISPGSTPV